MSRWIWTSMALFALAAAAGAAEPEPGRTDGPPGSEYGKGGYPYHRTPGQFYVEGFLGAAKVDVEPENAPGSDNSETDLIAGFNAGYLVEDWLGLQFGYGHIMDQQTDLFSGGVRSAYNMEPINYYFSLDAELYSPDQGETKFGIVPGAGIDVVLNNHLSAGLRFQHDFIFADDNISINRFMARVQFKF